RTTGDTLYVHTPGFPGHWAHQRHHRSPSLFQSLSLMTAFHPSPAHAPLSSGVDHYENFPVASWLCPPELRPAVAAIYHFARTADDMADEGDADATQRLADLVAYRRELESMLDGEAPSERWRKVFASLAVAL